MEDKFSIINKTRSKIPTLSFIPVKNDILGKNYSLSLAYITKEEIKKINKTYRNKNKPTNILSFSLSKTSGEILLCPSLIKNQTDKFGRNFAQLLGFLVIHGMLHLKGMQHSSTMETLENKYDQKYFCRNRHGVHDDKSRCGRISKRRKKS
ncbi:MAG: rRNA maturation RNase YbeY [Candidatus Paceibacterota bacterium]|jgi:probable rRNA maturation factor